MAVAPELDTPVAVVTGGSRGIGAATALALAEDGYDLALIYRRDRTAAESVARQIDALGRSALLVQVSIAEEDACTQAADAVLSEFGRADVLVHAAGVVSRGGDVADTPLAELDYVLRVHVHGPFALTRALLPAMRARRHGSIVFVSSAVTATMRAGGAPYNMAKAAMEALARTLAHEEQPHGIRVNIVSPGLVATELGRRFVVAAHNMTLQDLAPHLPFGRACQPADIGNVVRWLASNQASYVTGENIKVNGGDDTVASTGVPR
jgi:NAD(P)-dependent dehydrogenase (short-subunit alcohol dehydrogenase family)